MDLIVFFPPLRFPLGDKAEDALERFPSVFLEWNKNHDPRHVKAPGIKDRRGGVQPPRLKEGKDNPGICRSFCGILLAHVLHPLLTRLEHAFHSCCDSGTEGPDHLVRTVVIVTRLRIDPVFRIDNRTNPILDNISIG